MPSHTPLRLFVAGALIGGAARASAQSPEIVASPDGRTRVTVEVRDGALDYSVPRDGTLLIQPSRLGFAFRGAPPLRDSLRLTTSRRATHDETWTQPWGEVARVRDHHNELRVNVEERAGSHRTFAVV